MTIVQQDIQRLSNLLVQNGFTRDEITQLYKKLLGTKEEELLATITELLEALDHTKRETLWGYGSRPTPIVAGCHQREFSGGA
jgi:hypothetical protein